MPTGCGWGQGGLGVPAKAAHHLLVVCPRGETLGAKAGVCWCPSCPQPVAGWAVLSGKLCTTIATSHPLLVGHPHPSATLSRANAMQ